MKDFLKRRKKELSREKGMFERAASEKLNQRVEEERMEMDEERVKKEEGMT